MKTRFAVLIGIVFCLCAVSVLATGKVRAQVSNKMLFQLCSPFPFMKLEVFIQETGEPRILTEESIRSPIEHEMRKARIFADKDSHRMVPTLRVSVVKHFGAYSASIMYRRYLRGMHKDRWMKHSVWYLTRVGTAHSDQPILSAIKEEFDVFLDEFSLTQNSPECHAWKSEMKK